MDSTIKTLHKRLEGWQNGGGQKASSPKSVSGVTFSALKACSRLIQVKNCKIPSQKGSNIPYTSKNREAMLKNAKSLNRANGVTFQMYFSEISKFEVPEFEFSRGRVEKSSTSEIYQVVKYISPPGRFRRCLFFPHVPWKTPIRAPQKWIFPRIPFTT